MIKTATRNHHSATKSSKAAEIYREDNGTIYYLCFHCGFDSDNIRDTLAHIHSHFTSLSSETTVLSDKNFDFVNSKDEHIDEVYTSQLEQIFIDCGTKANLDKDMSYETDTFAGTEKPEQQIQLQPEDESTDLDGLFEWECLHCHRLFKKCAKLKQHLTRHNKDPVQCSIWPTSEVTEIKAHYTLKCTLCSFKFYHTHSAEKHLEDFHPASPPVKCFLCCETFQSAELLQKHTSSAHESAGTEAPVKKTLPTKTIERKKVPAEVVTKLRYSCSFCDKTFTKEFDFMQHNIGHFELKMFSCPKCPSHFQRKNTFDGHMRKIHQLKIKPKYFCRFCNDNVDHSDEVDFVTHAFEKHLDEGDRNNTNMDSTFDYQCRFCFQKFSKWNDVRAHSKTHVDDELPTVFLTEMENGRVFSERAKSGHRSEFLYHCHRCTNTLCGSYEARKHWVTVHQPLLSTPVRYRIVIPNRSFKCQDCGISFDTETHLMRHRFTHFNADIYSCPNCSQSFITRGSLTRHMTRKHEQLQYHQLICRYCKIELNEDSEFIAHNYKEHLYEISNIDRTKTTINNVGASVETKKTTVNNVETSVETETVIGAKTVVVANEDNRCKTCDLTFLTRRSVINHRAKIHPELITKRSKYNKKVGQQAKKKTKSPDGNQCNICNLTFVNNRSMVNHRTKRHPETVQASTDVRPTNTCKICGKIYREISNFKAHVKTHNDVRSYTCDICNKSFALKISLQTHILIHTNEKNFVCETCGKCFYTTSKLNFHKQVHENLTLQCTECDKVFYTRNNFSKHKKTHMEAERKTCKLCNNTFKSAVSLRVHMMLHDGEKRFTCRYCDLTFAQSSGRRGHERAKHGSL